MMIILESDAHAYSNHRFLPPSLSLTFPFRSAPTVRLGRNIFPETDVSPRGCFFRHSDIDPLYSYYYKRVTLLCSRSLHTRLLHSHRPFAVFAHRPKPGNTIIPKILLPFAFRVDCGKVPIEDSLALQPHFLK